MLARHAAALRRHVTGADSLRSEGERIGVRYGDAGCGDLGAATRGAANPRVAVAAA